VQKSGLISRRRADFQCSKNLLQKISYSEKSKKIKTLLGYEHPRPFERPLRPHPPPERPRLGTRRMGVRSVKRAQVPQLSKSWTRFCAGGWEHAATVRARQDCIPLAKKPSRTGANTREGHSCSASPTSSVRRVLDLGQRKADRETSHRYTGENTGYPWQKMAEMSSNRLPSRKAHKWLTCGT
jgi:hypothetical protein